jgi:hypothetical protein
MIRTLLVLLATQLYLQTNSQTKSDSSLRTIFIPGFGEDPTIFEKLHPLVAGEKIFIDHWQLLLQVPSKNLNVDRYADFLISRFAITNKDVLIGHSMGGWIALIVKQKVHCSIVQVASWTDQKKVFSLPVPKALIYLIAKSGLVFNGLVREIIILLYYSNKPSKPIFKSIFKALETGDKRIINKQLKVIVNDVSTQITVEPDVRIHAVDDPIIDHPAEPFIKVPGDHFSLYTHPEKVAKPINELLSLLKDDQDHS